MSRILPRQFILRPFIRLGLASRPILPIARSLHASQTSLSFPRRLFTPQLLRRFSSSPSSPPPSPSSSENSPPENASLTQRLKYLIKRYGWYALGMYIFFSTIDFGITFAAINYLGADHVSRLTDSIKASLPAIFQKEETQESQEGSHNGQESLYTMLLLAYTIHKTLLLPVRVGLTAAFTPRFVGWLGKRGWVGSSGARRAALEMRDKIRRNPRD